MVRNPHLALVSVIAAGACSSSSSDGARGTGGSAGHASGGATNSDGSAGLGGTISTGSHSALGGFARSSSGATGAATTGDAAADVVLGPGGSGSGGSLALDGGGGSPDDAGLAGAPKPSAGCGKTPTLAKSVPPPNTKMNYITITSGGQSRRYLLWYPDNYDNTHPYRLVLAYHWYTGSASQVFDCSTEGIKCYTTQSPFYGLLNLANNSTIFIAPDGLNAGWGNSNNSDVIFTDDILKQVEGDLCIDTARVFANGFSYGGGMTKAIGCQRPNVFRAIAVYSGADFLSGGCDNTTTSPIAYYGSHGLSDPTNAYSSGKTIRDRFVKNNGCTAQSPPEPTVGSKTHICTSYTGCSSGRPTRWCAFDGVHDPSPKDNGQDTTWNPKEVWTFLTQF